MKKRTKRASLSINQTGKSVLFFLFYHFSYVAMGCSPSTNSEKSQIAEKKVGADKKSPQHTGKDLEARKASVSTTASSGQGEMAHVNKMDIGIFVTQQKGRLTDRYVNEKRLGSGAYGEVVLCRDKITKAERAVKIIKKTSL